MGLFGLRRENKTVQGDKNPFLQNIRKPSTFVRFVIKLKIPQILPIISVQPT